MSSKTADAPAATSTKSKKPASKKARRKSAMDHPKVSEMVNEAIANLKDRNGSSLSAIKKYIAANFPVEMDKVAPYVRRYLKSQVATGTLIQTKGKGASGSFKLKGAATATAGPRKRPSAAVRAAAAAIPKPAKVVKTPKKVAKEKTKRSPKKAKTPKPKKAGKVKKSPAPKQEATA